MSDQMSFSREEWRLLGDAPLAACAAVALSSPGDGAREADAVLRSWREAADLFVGSALIQTLVRRMDPQSAGERADEDVAQPPSSEPQFDAVADEALDLCRRAVVLLIDRVAPEEVEDYQRFVLHLARDVANASSDGGLFGLGGDPVSRAERAVMREIADALGYQH